jgi:hypothetical protein
MSSVKFHLNKTPVHQKCAVFPSLFVKKNAQNKLKEPNHVFKSPSTIAVEMETMEMEMDSKEMEMETMEPDVDLDLINK